MHLLTSIHREGCVAFSLSLSQLVCSFTALAEIMKFLHSSGEFVLRSERTLEIPRLVWTVLPSCGGAQRGRAELGTSPRA